MAAVLGRSFSRAGDCCGSSAEADGIVYWDSPRRGCLSSPFVVYYTTTFFLNGVAIVAGVWSQINFHWAHTQYGAARGRYGYYYWNVDAWYLANAIFAVIHIAFAVYMVRQIQKPVPSSAVSKYAPTPYPATPYVQAYPVDGSAPPPSHPAPTPPMNPAYYHHQQQQPSTATVPYAPAVPLAHAAVVVPMDRQQQPPPTHPGPYYHHHHHHPYNGSHPYVDPADPYSARRAKLLTEPESWPRIKQVFCENPVVAVYIVIFAAYVAWHTLLDLPISGQVHPGLIFVMKCADIFVLAGPASMIFSLGWMLIQRREI